MHKNPHPWSRNLMVDYGQIPRSYAGQKPNIRAAFTKHHNHSYTRTRGMLYPILNKKNPIPTKTKLQIYITHIKPIIFYACPAWGPLILFTGKKLDSAQNTCLKTITTASPYVSNINLHDLSLNDAKKFFERTEKSSYPQIPTSHINKLGRTETLTLTNKTIRPFD